MFNPPENREELKDTLFFLGVNFTYKKIMVNGNHVFTLTTDNEVVSIHSFRAITINKLKFKSLYDAKLELMRRYL